MYTDLHLTPRQHNPLTAQGIPAPPRISHSHGLSQPSKPSKQTMIPPTKNPAYAGSWVAWGLGALGSGDDAQLGRWGGAGLGV